MIEVNNLTKSFDGRVVIDDISTRFKKGLVNMIIGRSGSGKTVFPSFKDAWHFDDKLAETYLLESVKAPIPLSFYYYNLKDVESAMENKDFNFPIIAKLRNGSGSHNVKLLKDKNELINYSKTMFSRGMNSAPSLMYKTTSNVLSVGFTTVRLTPFTVTEPLSTVR